MTDNCCLICKQDYQLFPSDVQEQVSKRFEELEIIFGAHEDLKRRHQIATLRSNNNIKSEVIDSSSEASIHDSLPRDVIEKPSAAVDILDMIETLNSAVKGREQELLLKSTILDNMKDHLSILSKELHTKRMAEALHIFRLIPIEASRSSVSKTSRGLLLKGCSSIAGFPIQNDGNYDGSPIDAVSAALMHVSRLLNAVSSALNVTLPHPLTPYSDSGAESMVTPQFDLTAGFYLTPAFYVNDGAEYHLFSWTSVADLRSQNGVDDSCGSGSSPVGPATNQQLSKGSSSKNSPRYVLNEAFEQALILLRADVVFLCLQSGLPAAMLWPSEAILLNLHLLQRHMQRALLPTEG